jgi:ketosteroid isomerase-like protein
MAQRRRLLAAGAIALPLAGFAPTPTFNAPADVAAIVALETRIAGELDADKLIEHYADDAVVLDIFTPGTFQGREAIRAGFAPSSPASARSATRRPRRSVATNGTFACAAMQISFQTEMKDGTRFTMNLRQLDALKRSAGRWMIHTEHIALPSSQDDDRTHLSQRPARQGMEIGRGWRSAARRKGSTC